MQASAPRALNDIMGEALICRRGFDRAAWLWDGSFFTLYGHHSYQTKPSFHRCYSSITFCFFLGGGFFGLFLLSFAVEYNLNAPERSESLVSISVHSKLGTQS